MLQSAGLESRRAPTRGASSFQLSAVFCIHDDISQIEPVEVIIGSELAYSTTHSNLLFNVVQLYLKPKGCFFLMGEMGRPVRTFSDFVEYLILSCSCRDSMKQSSYSLLVDIV